MRCRSLISAAFLFLGIIGCDDPEIEEKVADILQYGAVSAELHCTNVPVSMCGAGSTSLHVDMHRFVDGSHSMKVKAEGAFTLDSYEFVSKDAAVKLRSTYNNGYPVEVQLDTDTGILDITVTCISGSPPSDSADLNSEGTCTGRKLEVFGITP